MKSILVLANLMAMIMMFIGCNSEGTGPVIIPAIPCEDPAVLSLKRFSVTKHKHPVLVKGTTVTMPGMEWAHGDSVQAFFGGKDIKLVFTLNRLLYLVTYVVGEPSVTLISHNDEGVNGAQGSINSPLISPDGKKILYPGTTLGKPAFMLDAVAGDADAWRVPIDPKARVTADPHWYREGNKTWIYFATLAGLVSYSDRCAQISGNTYRIEVTGDTSVGPIDTSGIPGAFRGGISKDGQWAGTSYATTALYDRSNQSTRVLANGEQQCNPSMNPFPIGSKHMDYIMVLAFGGTEYATITGKPIIEGLHENLWIYNRDNKIVWQAKRTDETFYLRWDKPEWSTHPEFATAVALRRGDGDGDLYVIKIGDLADKDEGELNQAQAYLKIGKGGFTSDSYSHLWVAP
jgi:hypothetical protein